MELFFIFQASYQLILKEVNFKVISWKNKQSNHLENIKIVLEEENYTMSDVVNTTFLLSDIDDFAAMNEVYNEFFS